MQISVIRHGHDSVAPQSFSGQRGPSHRFVPGGWILSRRDFEPEAKRPCLGPRDAAKPVSELRGRSPPKEMGEKKIYHAADAMQGMVSFPRHPEEGVTCECSIGTANGGPMKQAASVRPCCRGFRPAEASGLPANFQGLGGKSISERTHSLNGVMIS